MEQVAPKLNRIAIGLDFGAPSLNAARWVARTLAPNAELILIHALDDASLPSSGDPVSSPEVRRVVRDEAARRLRDFAATLDGEADIRFEIREGRAARVVAAVAEESAADLIVVGPHGGRESTRGIGSTAERLIRVSSVPVMLVPEMEARAPRHLLVPVDEMDLTLAVVQWADLFARREGVNICLMHVLDPRRRLLATVPAGAATAIGDDGAQLPGEFAEYAETKSRWISRLRSEFTGVNRAAILTTLGVPGDEIVAMARRVDADLIVMGRRGRGLKLPGVVGGTSSVVLRQAPCPVLIVVDPADAIGEEWDVDETPAQQREFTDAQIRRTHVDRQSHRAGARDHVERSGERSRLDDYRRADRAVRSSRL